MANTEPNPQVPGWSIQDRLRKAREHGGFKSQRDLAEAIGTSEATVARYESGTITRMKPLVLKQWAMACGVVYEWLIEDETNGRSIQNWKILNDSDNTGALETEAA